MKIHPKVVLILVVLVVTGTGAWIRAVYAKPWMERKSSERTVARLEEMDKLRTGDVIFQTSRSPQSRAIQAATHSSWTHCGILARRKGHWFVLEAIQPVTFTSLSSWIARGRDGRFLLMRLDSPANPPSSIRLQALVDTGMSFLGKPYDPLFGWGDDRIYCSELVWKTYHRAWGVDLGQAQSLATLDLSSPSARNLVKARLGTANLPTDTLITPESIRRSPLLETVAQSP